MASPAARRVRLKEDGNRLHQFRKIWSTIVRRGVDRRLTARVQVKIPISVRSEREGRDSSSEATHTISINAHGGMIPIRMPVQPGQRLLVTNHGNNETQEAEVVWVRAKKPQCTNIGFRFSSAAPEFWANLEIGKQKR